MDSKNNTNKSKETLYDIDINDSHINKVDENNNNNNNTNNNNNYTSLHVNNDYINSHDKCENKSGNMLFNNVFTKFISNSITYYFDHCFFLKQMIFQLYNFNLSFISFFTLFIYMNIIILICLPFSIIKSYLWFIYFFFASIKGMLFVINHDIGGGRAWYNKIFNLLYCIVMEILLFFCYIICALFLFTIGNTLNLFVILSSIILCLTCQSILWPIIDSVKSFKIINNIIKGYCNGMRNEYYQNIKNGKQIRYTCNSNINDIKDKIKDISNDNFENNYILKSSIMLDDEENNKGKYYYFFSLFNISTNKIIKY